MGVREAGRGVYPSTRRAEMKGHRGYVPPAPCAKKFPCCRAGISVARETTTGRETTGK